MKKHVCLPFFISLMFINCSVKTNLQNRHFKEVSILYKPFYQKNNNKIDFKEIFINYKNKDYFVKFCKSAVTRNQLEKYLSEIPKEQKIRLNFSLFNGSWDVCDGDYQIQSRIGEYAVIHKIKKN